jgi:hypothetical protein
LCNRGEDEECQQQDVQNSSFVVHHSQVAEAFLGIRADKVSMTCAPG